MDVSSCLSFCCFFLGWWSRWWTKVVWEAPLLSMNTQKCWVKYSYLKEQRYKVKNKKRRPPACMGREGAAATPTEGHRQPGLCSDKWALCEARGQQTAASSMSQNYQNSSYGPWDLFQISHGSTKDGLTVQIYTAHQKLAIPEAADIKHQRKLSYCCNPRYCKVSTVLLQTFCGYQNPRMLRFLP